MNKRIIAVLLTIFISLNLIYISEEVNAAEKSDSVSLSDDNDDKLKYTYEEKDISEMEKPTEYVTNASDVTEKAANDTKSLSCGHTYEVNATNDVNVAVVSDIPKYDYVIYDENNVIKEYSQNVTTKSNFNLLKGFKLIIKINGTNNVLLSASTLNLSECSKPLEFNKYVVKPNQSISITNRNPGNINLTPSYTNKDTMIFSIMVNKKSRAITTSVNPNLYLGDEVYCVNEYGGDLIITLPKSDDIKVTVKNTLNYILEKGKTYSIKLRDGVSRFHVPIEKNDKQNVASVYFDNKNNFDNLSIGKLINSYELSDSNTLNITNNSECDLKLYFDSSDQSKVQINEIKDKVELTEYKLDTGKCYEISNTGSDYICLNRIASVSQEIDMVKYDAKGNVIKYYGDGYLFGNIELSKGEKAVVNVKGNTSPTYTTLLKYKKDIKIVETPITNCIEYNNISALKTFKMTNNSDEDIVINIRSNSKVRVQYSYVIKNERNEIVDYYKSLMNDSCERKLEAHESICVDLITGDKCSIYMPYVYDKYVTKSTVGLENNIVSVPIRKGRKYTIMKKEQKGSSIKMCARDYRATYNESVYDLFNGDIDEYKNGDFQSTTGRNLKCYYGKMSLVENTSDYDEEVYFPKEYKNDIEVVENNHLYLTKTKYEGAKCRENVKFSLDSVHINDVNYRVLVKDANSKIVYDTGYKNSNSFNWMPIYSGNYSIEYSVKDSVNSMSSSFTRNIFISKNYLNNSLKISSEKQYVNCPISIINRTTGGEGIVKYKYVLHNIDTNKDVQTVNYCTKSKITWIPKTEGRYVIKLWVKDENGEEEFATQNVTVLNRQITTTVKKEGSNYLAKRTIIAKCNGTDINYKFTLYKNNKIVNSTEYGKKNYCIWTPKAEGNYILQISAKDKYGNIIKKNLYCVIKK